ncbi:hypothetical protein F5Y17DRAFT_429909 [Xylariaceae sp. FL0594]|nr:hypothetical protein F5Y17DRAFT_429909 [Xylariaceae sp. FL0594]
MHSLLSLHLFVSSHLRLQISPTLTSSQPDNIANSNPAPEDPVKEGNPNFKSRKVTLPTLVKRPTPTLTMFGFRLRGGGPRTRGSSKLLSFVAVAVSGMMLVAILSSMVKFATAEVSPIADANPQGAYHYKYDLKQRDGPYTYVEAVLFPNATLVNETSSFPNATGLSGNRTVNVTTAYAATETANPTSEAIVNSTTSTDTPTTMHGGYGYVPTESGTSSSDAAFFTSTADAVGYTTSSVASSSTAGPQGYSPVEGSSTADVVETSTTVVSLTDYTTGTVIVQPSSSSSSFSNTSQLVSASSELTETASVQAFSSTEAAGATGVYTVTVTATKVVFRGCDDGDDHFTGTQTVTITPRVTTIDTTTVTTYPMAVAATAHEVSLSYGTVTTTDYLTGTVTVTVSTSTSDASTQSDSEGSSSASSSGSGVTTVVTQTVIPIPQSSDTTCTESSTAGNATTADTQTYSVSTVTVTDSSTVSNTTTADILTYSVSTVTVTVSESTMTTTTQSIGYSVDSMHGNDTASATTTMTADAVTASEVSTTTTTTTCTEGSTETAAASTGSYSAMTTTPDATNTPYPVTRTVFWSASPSCSISSSSLNDTRASVVGTVGTVLVPTLTLTDGSVVLKTVSSAIIVHATATNGPVTSGGRKSGPRWNGENGGSFGSCAVMVVAFSIAVQAFVI